ncbi:UDP-glucose dehydrogenase family protein [Calditerricola satsumensis]|uniref:UDP-glucose 6-dehydrogenase n=1 Tax=Calditerricola satsumensis TaxID=373054 RepID=A0A8J3FBD1_9BACI|nr:UDP-glucose/GDP-mannose dehydrogenase family protein [Calditerricola satsumensis]GGJ95937.1 UDP-glucose 6-dehydrogenase [Calditerricola satsumensis]
MDIAVIGTGYVGLVTGACLAELGHRVVCMDRDKEKISLLNNGVIPIYEKGLDELVARNVAAGRLRFTDRMIEAIRGAEAVFLAVGTPTAADGGAELSMIFEAAEQIAMVMESPLILIQKSTCPVGTSVEIERRVAAVLAKRGVQIPFHVVVNPEFLREGTAVTDFMQPDRVVIGADTAEVGERVAMLYEKIVPKERILLMDRASAEMTKYAANAFLATKISFINEIANLCELVGADIESVRRGIGTDTRIGPAFLAAGIGYGGSCFPKDVKALIKTGKDAGYQLRILESVDEVNRQQRIRQVEKVIQHFGGSLEGKRIAVWGLAFKPGTDDMREAPAIDVIHCLLREGAEVVAYDPIAMPQAQRVLDQRVRYASDALSCVDGADAVLLLTEWPEFLGLDLHLVAQKMATPVLFDFRNGFSPNRAYEAGLTYIGVGRKTKVSLKPITEPITSTK